MCKTLLNNPSKAIHDILHFTFHGLVKSLVGDKVKRHDWLREVLERLVPKRWICATINRWRCSNTRYGPRHLRDFVVSVPLAEWAAQVTDRRLDVTARRLPGTNEVDISIVRSEIGDRFIKMLAGLAAITEMAGQSRQVIVSNPGFDFSENREALVLHFLGLPSFPNSSEFIIDLHKQFMLWLRSQGGSLRYAWGIVELLDDCSIVLRLGDSAESYSSRGTRAQLIG